MKWLLLLLALTVQAHGQRFVQTVNTVTDAVRLGPSNIHTHVHALGYNTRGDGGGGIFTFTNSITSTNKGTRLAMSTAGWSLDRIYDGPVDVRFFGVDSYDDHDLIQEAREYAQTQGKALMLLDGSIDDGFRQISYSVYIPSITRSTLMDGATGAYPYNHDASLAWYGGKWWAAWNANPTSNLENGTNQVNVISHSTDFISWTAPYEPFNSSTYSSNPVTINKNIHRQWQPNLIVVGSELWSIWMQDDPTVPGFGAGRQMYFSKLTDPNGKWSNTALNLNLQADGMTFYGFPTQNPIQLHSGRVIAPVSWNATNFVSTAMVGFSATAQFWANEGRSGVIYTDDGVTWKVGGYTTIPGNNERQWEPVITQHKDGSLRMFVRNLNYFTIAPDKGMWTSVGTSDGLSFEPGEYMRMHVASSRLGMTHQDGRHIRHLGFIQDWKPTGNISSDRYNLAMFTSRTSGSDLIPGVGFSGTGSAVAYPQAALKDGKVHVVYSEGTIPRSIKTALINPAPSVDSFYITPRLNDYINPFVYWTNAPTDQFVYNSASVMQGVVSTDTWTTTSNVTVGAWIYRDNSENFAVFDNRDLDWVGMLFMVVANDPTLFLRTTPTNFATYTFSTLNVPASEWVYLGLSIDGVGATATAYVTTFAGASTTETKAITSQYLTGTTPRFGGAVQGSTVGTLTGKIKHIVVVADVVGSANNHRYIHGLDQATLSATDWAGVETSPGTFFYDFWADDPDAGLNNTAWLAEFSSVGLAYRGTAASGTTDGKASLITTGTGSASVEVPEFSQQEQFTFGTKFYMSAKTATFDQIIATVGDAASKLVLLSRASNPTKIEVYNAATGQYQEAGTYASSQWIPLNIRFDADNVSIAVNSNAAVINKKTEQHPRLFLGHGYLGQFATDPDDSVSFEIAATGGHVSSMIRQYTGNLNSSVTNLTITAASPRINIVDTDTSVTNFIHVANQTLRFSRTNSVTFNDADIYMDLVNGEVRVASDSASSGFKAYSEASGYPGLIGIAIQGTLGAPSATTNAQLLTSVRGSGYGATGYSTSRGRLDFTASEAWTDTAQGSQFALSVTPNGTTTPVQALTVENDSDIVWNGAAPFMTVNAANGTSGMRLNVTGGSTAILRLQSNAVTQVTIDGYGNITTLGGNITFGSSAQKITAGAGTPEGVVTAPVGSMFLRSDGGAGTTLYIKESGAGNTGWVAK